METFQKFVIFAILATAISNVQSEMIEVDEGSSHNITCPAGYGVNVDSSHWNMKFFNAENFYVPTNWRSFIYTPAFIFGGCSYDVSDKIKTICNGRNVCTLKPTNDLLGGCNYNKYLRVYYWCQPCEEPKRKRRAIGEYSYVKGYGYLFVMGVCNLVARLPQKSADCPNGQFVGKHVCTNCHDTVLSASMFAHQVENMRFHGSTSATTFNSIFIASSMAYTQNGQYCVFNYRVPKWDCYKNNGVWSCTRMGEVIATHSSYTGHYYPQADA